MTSVLVFPLVVLFSLGAFTISLRIWRQRKSSLPFILGQAVLAAFLLWKNMQTFSLKKCFPLSFMLPSVLQCFASTVTWYCLGRIHHPRS
ncbi:hypothetical protein K7X08_031226 [Anisodus acutangulus]|uniref:Uncharacterized protein n=1 Tax=Anisodus acutangulus TaxID=402998 RepID=A0A9Q1RLX7_9SOLA|nr:hypothetical protein K7X08_031226 [Anisodus acutangulus]